MAHKEYTIVFMQSEDWNQVHAIYLEGIATGKATFETEAPDWIAWDSAHHPFCRLVAWDGGYVVGWAGLSPVSSRSAYRGVAEVSVYVAATARGKGVGLALLQQLIDESEGNGVWTLQASILAENLASLTIHKKCGFREVGRREKIGKLNALWQDVILMERRSKCVGTD
jgi:L-amino acid N-acyltransferase YncA